MRKNNAPPSRDRKTTAPHGKPARAHAGKAQRAKPGQWQQRGSEAGADNARGGYAAGGTQKGRHAGQGRSPSRQSRSYGDDRRDGHAVDGGARETLRTEGHKKPRFHPDKTKQKRFERSEQPRRPFKPRAPSPTPAASKPAHTAAQPRHGQGQLLHGLHAVREAWLNPARRCRQLWLTPAVEASFAPVLAEAEQRGLNRPEPVQADRALLDSLLPGTVHQGIALDAAPLPETHLNDLLAKQPRLLVVLDQVTDPHNVGAILRSAAAFGAEGVILTERHAPGMTGTLAKTASGALEHVPLVPVVNLARALEQLREAGFWCIGLAEEGEKSLGAHDLSGATALVLGAEGDGLRRLTRERCDALAKLPTQGAIGSLNVSNAAAIALYEAKRQRQE